MAEVEQGRLRPRRGHVPQISISDDNHHVTEAIGDLYGDNDWNNRDSRTSIYTASPPFDDATERRSNYFESSTVSSHTNETNLSKSLSTDKASPLSNGSPTAEQRRKLSLPGSPDRSSPPPLARTPSADTATQPFPLNDIDYESSPAAVAQELSNLQAIRRMSMNIDAADPDLPTFGGAFPMPSAAPSHSSSDDDTSRLFWVPARLHPELAPKEFKTFVEDRVDRIRRRSIEESTPGGLEPVDRKRSSGGVQRRKSTLSRQIDSPIGFEDGAEVLERKRSESSQSNRDSAETTLQELESLVSDPSSLVRKMSIDSARRSLENDNVEGDDIPMLPSQPSGQSLKRSTRTNYRRGSLRKGERVDQVPFSKRISNRMTGSSSEAQANEEPTSPTTDESDLILSRAQTEPVMAAQPTENFSRPSRIGRPGRGVHASASMEDMNEEGDRGAAHPKSFQSRIASNGRTTASLPGIQQQPQIPQIVETPPVEHRHSSPTLIYGQPLPERTSSHGVLRTNSLQSTMDRQSLRPAYARTSHQQSLDDMANNPSPMLGTNTRTDDLSFIPTYTLEKKSEREKEKGAKSKDRKDSTDSGSSKKNSFWNTLRSNDDRDKKEDKESKKSKKANKSTEKPPHDSTRLDILQTTSDGPRGRESIVLDRPSVKLEDDRKPKKESGSGIFATLFGGGKKKADRDSTGSTRKASSSRSLTPEPPLRLLRADIDYNWTRFSILEERAIYRMAHIKLANPRRALYSQVLLSNFMYSYLAKVQQMHPQIQIPQYINQKQQGGMDQQQPVQHQESDEFSQWQRYQEQQERMAHSQAANASNMDGGSHHGQPPGGFIDDFDPSHQQAQDAQRQQQQQQQQQQQYYLDGSNGMYDDGSGGQQMLWAEDHYTRQGLFDDSRTPDDSDMW